jgi:hypothetical protein
MEPRKNNFWITFGTETDPTIDQQKIKNETKFGTASGEQKWEWKMQIL